MWDCIQSKKACPRNGLHTQVSGRVTDKTERVIFWRRKWPVKEHGVKSGWKQEKEKQAGWKSLSWELQERRYLYMPEFASSHPPYHNPGKTLTYILKIEKGKKKKKEKKDFTLLDK